MDINIARLRAEFDYDWERGGLIRKKNGRWTGSLCVRNRGYRRIIFKNVWIYVHRLVWAWHYGAIPSDKQVDHIDRDRLNNRIENLRLVTRRENMRNAGLQTNSTSGYKGVHFRKARQKWVARIMYDGKNSRYLGSYSSPADAARAYDAAAIRWHGDYAVTNASLGLLNEE